MLYSKVIKTCFEIKSISFFIKKNAYLYKDYLLKKQIKLIKNERQKFKVFIIMQIILCIKNYIEFW